MTAKYTNKRKERVAVKAFLPERDRGRRLADGRTPWYIRVKSQEPGGCPMEGLSPSALVLHVLRAAALFGRAHQVPTTMDYGLSLLHFCGVGVNTPRLANTAIIAANCINAHNGHAGRCVRRGGGAGRTGESSCGRCCGRGAIIMT